jgi:transcriptional regulator of nitric oxide reductase
LIFSGTCSFKWTKRLVATRVQVLPECKVIVETDPAPEVAAFRAERGHRQLGSAYVPADRVSARAYASVAEATVITVPAEAVVGLEAPARHPLEGSKFLEIFC